MAGAAAAAAAASAAGAAPAACPSGDRGLTGSIVAAMEEVAESLPLKKPGRQWDACMALPAVVMLLFALSKLKTLRHKRTELRLGKAVELLAALGLFLVSGPSVIILNKHIMKEHHFHFPILMASLGNLLMMLLTRTAVALRLARLDSPHMDWQRYSRVVLLMVCFNFGTHVLGMASYMFLSVPLIQILKSTTVVIVLALAKVLLNEPLNGMLVVSVLIIMGGTGLSALSDEGHGKLVGSSEARANAIGVMLSILASAMEAAKTICSQILMDSLSVFDGLYWSSPAFVLVASCFIAVLELRQLIEHPFTPELVGLLALNSVLTGVIVLSSFWFVKLVGALVLKVVTQARTVCLVLASVLFFGERCSSLQYVGYAVCLVGIALFDKAKGVLAEQRKAKMEESPCSNGKH